MKVARMILATLICSLPLLVPNTVLLADRAIPPTSELLVGSWIGYEDGSLYFYRLVLAIKGTGSLSVLFNDETPEMYRVDDWRIADGKLSLKLSPKSKNAEEISITVTHVDALRMDLIVNGVTNKWQRKATVFNEREFLKRSNKTERAR